MVTCTWQDVPHDPSVEHGTSGRASYSKDLGQKPRPAGLHCSRARRLTQPIGMIWLAHVVIDAKEPLSHSPRDNGRNHNRKSLDCWIEYHARQVSTFGIVL